MTKYGKRACALAITVIGFFSVAAHAQQCATPAATDFYVDKDNASASDSANGHYTTTSGGTGPYKTIQHLVDTLQPGQCGWVKASATPYYENTWENGDYSGITFTHGGTSDTQRVFVSGYPGQMPIVDQQRAAATKGYSLAGFFIYSGAYITLQNFEVRNTTASGILLNPSGSGLNYINITGNHVHNMAGTGNPNNVGGIRIDFCHYCNITNNIVNNIGDDQGADGINAFQPGNCVIANNLIYNAAIGVQLKQADNSGANLNAHDVHANIMANLNTAAYKMQIQGANSMAAPHNPTFHDNIVYNVPTAIWTDLQEAGQQATNLTVYNNTFINVGRLAGISNFSGVQIYNNIYVGAASTPGASPAFIFDTVNPTPWVNQVSYYDNNLYNNITQSWQIETYNNPTSYSSLASWRTATREVTTPDLKSQFADPKFSTGALAVTNLLLGSVSDYALQAGSPALTMGRNGDTIGAVRPGVSIGPSGTAVLTTGSGTTTPPPAAVIPNPPSDVTVQ
jgi:hypothetical protein